MISSNRIAKIGALLSGLVIAFLSASLIWGRLFWFDELSTWVVAAQPTSAGVLAALAAGTDSLPPLFFLLTHWCLQLPLDPHVALRLPALVGCVLCLACVYAISWRLTGCRWTAWFGLLFFAVNGARSYYSEGRPYGISLGVIAVALWAWLRSSDEDARWPHHLALFAALAVLPSLHYYNGLVFVPFCLSELYRLLVLRSFRWPVWAGLTVGTMLLLPNLKYIAAFKAAFGNNFWAKANFSAVPIWFEDLYKIRGDFAIGLHLGLAALLVWQIYEKRKGPATAENFSVDRFSVERCIWALGALSLPAVAFVAAKVLQGGMTGRYFLAALFGALFALLLFVGQLPFPQRIIALVAMAPIVLAQASVGLATWRGGTPVAARQATLQREFGFLSQPQFTSVPVLMASGHAYPQAAYYLNPHRQQKISILIHPPSAVKYLDTDSVDQAIRLLAAQSDWKIETEESVKQLPIGSLVIAGTGFTWNVQYLTDKGYGLLPIGLTPQGQVYRITSKP